MLYYWSWNEIVYTTGVIGVGWCIIWILLVTDSPATHKCISDREREYIESNQGMYLTSGRVCLKESLGCHEIFVAKNSTSH